MMFELCSSIAWDFIIFLQHILLDVCPQSPELSELLLKKEHVTYNFDMLKLMCDTVLFIFSLLGFRMSGAFSMI